MNWTEVKIYTSTEGIEPLTAGTGGMEQLSLFDSPA